MLDYQRPSKPGSFDPIALSPHHVAPDAIVQEDQPPYVWSRMVPPVTRDYRNQIPVRATLHPLRPATSARAAGWNPAYPATPGDGLNLRNVVTGLDQPSRHPKGERRKKLANYEAMLQRTT
jgi:hypothetical protein